MVPSDLKHMAVDHIVKKRHLSCSLFKILPRAVHCPQKKYPANRWFSEETHLSNHVIPIRRHQLGAKAKSTRASFV